MWELLQVSEYLQCYTGLLNTNEQCVCGGGGGWVGGTIDKIYHALHWFFFTGLHLIMWFICCITIFNVCQVQW